MVQHSGAYRSTFSITILCCLLIILPLYSCKTDGFIISIGPTRSGKSCFINTITGKDLAKVGDDSGDSTTKTSELFKSKIDGFPEQKEYYLVDTMGLDDSEESELADHIIFANSTLVLRDLMETRKRNLDAFLIFESLTNDSNQLTKTLKKLKAVYNNKIAENSVVILNKNPYPNQRRVERLMTIAKKEGIKHIIHWRSGCGTVNQNALHDTYYDQMEFLYKTIDEAKSLTLFEMENLISDLVSEGKEAYRRDQKKWVGLLGKVLQMGGSVALLTAGALNIPALLAYNLAVFVTEETIHALLENETFLITIAIEERIRRGFSRKDDL